MAAYFSSWSLDKTSCTPAYADDRPTTDCLAATRFRNDLATLAVPLNNRVVVTARGQRFAIGTKGDGPDRAAMAFEGGQQLLSGDIPELECVVVTARGQGFAIGTKGHGLDRAAMAVERLARSLTGGDIPELECVVVTARGRVLPSGLKATALTAVAMAVEGGQSSREWRHPRA